MNSDWLTTSMIKIEMSIRCSIIKTADVENPWSAYDYYSQLFCSSNKVDYFNRYSPGYIELSQYSVGAKGLIPN